MAANGVRRALHSSSSTGRILFSRSSSAPKLGKSAGFAFGNGSSSSRSSLRRLTSSRLDLRDCTEELGFLKMLKLGFCVTGSQWSWVQGCRLYLYTVLLLQPCSLRCCLSAIKAGVAFQKVLILLVFSLTLILHSECSLHW